jgi:uncharacterized protein
MQYDKEFLSFVKEILDSKEFQKRKKYDHHENESVYEHSMKVAYSSYLYAKKHKLNTKDISIGGLLHDFYYKPWKENTKKVPFFKKHGFVHAKEAYDNACKHFPNLMNDRIKDIITKHMFPLNIKFPKYRESWIVSLMDKKHSFEVLKHPSVWPQYLGLSKKNKKKEDKQ